MKVLFLAAEATPFVKVGGLADVAGELPPVLRSLGAQVRVVLPFHASLHQQNLDIELLLEVMLNLPHGRTTAKIYRAKQGERRVYLVEGDPVRSSEGIYGDPASDAHKFTFTFLAAMQAMRNLGWQPDILHAHDWHAAPAVAWLSMARKTDPFWESVASLLTVHNLPYMGVGGESAMEFFGLTPSHHPNLPYWARSTPLPMGLASADWINTVSPTYAREIQSEAFSHGLEDLLCARSDRLIGILNGIDVQHWNPETDPSITENYSNNTLTVRRQNKAKLQEELNLESDLQIPTLCMISRLDFQKGIDVALTSIENLGDERWQFVLLGSGDQALEARARSFEDKYGGNVRTCQRFDAQLARRIYAGADMIIIPSFYEPCGLTQMIAMRYGCVPLVSATGGLTDTVDDYQGEASGTGFVFQPVEPTILTKTILRAMTTYSDQRRWRGLQLRGMAQDFSWGRSAQQYLNLYQTAIAERQDRK